ncbi:MAG: ATP-binding protein [Bacteroides sp.]|nr:ATP-binding protein [Bacillota bacterium]MCM1393819.1 ATP-binding protein [[Eubacterium] siraeum]MCM1455450.1 ATP-binding protein [Bacteroides sp.]
MYIKRHIEKVIDTVKNTYPVTLVTGPRQVGKSTLLKNLYPDIDYETLDNPLLLQAIASDPVGYLKLQGTPFIIDEVQRLPELFLSLKYIVDTNKASGMYFLSGSQKFELMKGVSESLSGRISVIDMLGLSSREIYGDTFDLPFMPTLDYLSERKSTIPADGKELWRRIHRGSMPKLYDDNDMDWERYYSDYVNTYIERDIQRLEQVGNGLTFLQFMVSLASRTGELLNMESIAKDVGISAMTVKKWISILQKSNVIYLLQPFSLNISKRIVKMPKVYFTDTGLVAYLCKWLTPETLMNGAMAGNIFETHVISEVIKSYYNAGREPNIYYYRDTNGNEVDLLFYQNGTLYPVEIKKTSSPNLKDIKHFKNLEDAYPTVDIGQGGVICTYEKILPLGENNRIIPINFI